MPFIIIGTCLVPRRPAVPAMASVRPEPFAAGKCAPVFPKHASATAGTCSVCGGCAVTCAVSRALHVHAACEGTVPLAVLVANTLRGHLAGHSGWRPVGSVEAGARPRFDVSAPSSVTYTVESPCPDPFSCALATTRRARPVGGEREELPDTDKPKCACPLQFTVSLKCDVLLRTTEGTAAAKAVWAFSFGPRPDDLRKARQWVTRTPKASFVYPNPDGASPQHLVRLTKRNS